MKILNDKLELVKIVGDKSVLSPADTFIITRFNLRLWTKDKHNRTTQSEEWLKQRFELFEKFCFPSIKNQTDKNFIWLCLFDEQTPSEYLGKIQSYIQESHNFLPVFLDEKDSKEVSQCISDLIHTYMNDNHHLITIRLDNDDALNVRFIDEVKRFSSTMKGTNILSFKYGIQYYTTEKMAVHIPFYNNHFLVMVNNEYDFDEWKNRTVQHVLQFNHFDTEKYPYPFVCNTKVKDMWAEVIHATNVSNDCKMTLNQGPVQEASFLKTNYNWGGKLRPCRMLVNASSGDLWQFAS